MTKLLAAVRDGKWYWGLGDPDAGAVIVTGMYLAAAGLCLLVARRWKSVWTAPSHVPRCRFESRVWLLFAVLLFLLGVNKQADFQSLLTLYGRDILRSAGLYEVRRKIQALFIVGVGITACLSVLVGIWAVWKTSWPCRAALAGLAIQSAFIVVRAASFHHVDRVLGVTLSSVKLNLVFESIGLIVVLTAAAIGLKRQPPLPTAPAPQLFTTDEPT
jgi:hypothetical protein